MAIIGTNYVGVRKYQTLIWQKQSESQQIKKIALKQ